MSKRQEDSAGNDRLAELLSSRVRAAVLGYLVARDEERFSLTELSRALGLPVSSVQHECYKLEGLGVLKGRREGASRRYWLDRTQPFVPVLMWLVVSMLGEDAVLRSGLRDIEGLEGLFVGAGERPLVVVIGEVDLAKLADVERQVTRVLQVADIEMAFYGRTAWDAHLQQQHPVVHRVRQDGTRLIIGDGHALLPAGSAAPQEQSS